MFNGEKIRLLKAKLELWEKTILEYRMTTDKQVENLDARITGLESSLFTAMQKIECQARQLEMAAEALLKMTTVIEGLKPKIKVCKPRDYKPDGNGLMKVKRVKK